MADINPILAAARQTSSNIDTNSAAIQSARSAQQMLSDDDASTQLDIGLNNQIIIGQKNQADLATQNAKLKVGAVTGTDMSLQGEAISGLVGVMNDAYNAKMAALKDIQDKKSVGFMDNPLEYIVNQFTINDDIDKHNSALEIEQAAKTHIDQLNQVADTVSKNQNNFNQSLTQASITASTENTLKVAELASNKAQIEGLGYNIAGLTEAINADKDKLNIRFQTLAAQNAQAQLGLAMQTYALHKQEFDWKMEEKKNAADTDEMFVDRIQQGLKVMYGPNAPDLTASPKLAKQYLTLLKSGTPAGKEATEAYMAGQSGVLGGNPAQVIDSMRTGMKFNMTPAQQPIQTLFDTATNTVANGVASGSIQKAGAVDALNQQVRTQVNTMLKDIEPGDSRNLFNIGSVASLVQMPGVVDTPLAQKVLAPAVASGAKLDDPKQVVATALAGVQDGSIKLADAVDGIVTLYQKGVETNLATRELPKFGIVPDDSMRSYKTKIQTNPTAFIGGTEIIDLTDKNAVARALNKSLAASQTLNFRTATGGM